MKRLACWLSGAVCVLTLAGSAFADTPAPLRRPPTAQGLRGIYALDQEITFNVLDRVYFDPASGQITLIGHRDARYGGPRILYFDLLATLLESSNPEFSMHWTSESEKRVDRLLERFGDESHEFSAEGRNKLVSQWTNFFNHSGTISDVGRDMFPSMGILPSWTTREPGYLGADVESINGGRVRVTEVADRTPAARAGLVAGDTITSVNGNSPVDEKEFNHVVRFLGSGAKLMIGIQRSSGQVRPMAVVLGKAPGDPWRGFDQQDYTEGVFRAIGNVRAAEALHAFRVFSRVQQTTAQEAALQNLIGALGLRDTVTSLQQDVRDRRLSPQDGLTKMMRALCEAQDSIFNLAGQPVTAAFDANLSSTHNPISALGVAFEREDSLNHDLLSQTVDQLFARPDGVQIPARLVDSTLDIHSIDVQPEYIRLDGHSELARVMFEADYLGKSLLNMPELASSVGGYQTFVAFRRSHPHRHFEHTNQRMWISVSRLDVVKANGGSTLETRGAYLQFNIRDVTERGQDLQEVSGYDQMLTTHYDDLELQFPVLHHLRECAKLVGVASWLKSRNPHLKFPTDGRAKWTGLPKVPGKVYLYLHRDVGQRGYDTTLMPTGGVSLGWLGAQQALAASDATVVDLRNDSLVAVPEVYDNHVLSRILNRKIEVPVPRPPGWVATAREGTQWIQSASIVLSNALADSEQDLELRKKLQRAKRLAYQLMLTDRAINAINQQGPAQQQAFAELIGQLNEARDQFKESALSIIEQQVLDVRESLGSGPLKELANSGAEIKTQEDKLDDLKRAMADIRSGQDSGQMVEAALKIAEEWSQAIQALMSGPGGQYLTPMLESLSRADDMRDIVEFGRSLSVLYTGGQRLEQLSSLTERQSQVLRDSLLPLRKHTLDQLDAIARDPSVERLY